MIATQVALFQGATVDPKVHADMGGKVENMNALGCLACRKPDLFGTLIDKAQKTRHRDRVGAIKALGEQWVRDAGPGEGYTCKDPTK